MSIIGSVLNTFPGDSGCGEGGQGSVINTVKQRQVGIAMVTEGLEQALSRYSCQRVEHVEEVAAVCVSSIYMQSPSNDWGGEGQEWKRVHR